MKVFEAIESLQTIRFNNSQKVHIMFMKNSHRGISIYKIRHCRNKNNLASSDIFVPYC